MGCDGGKYYQFKARSAMRKVLPFAILWGLGNLGCAINIGSRWEEPVVSQEYTDSGLLIQDSKNCIRGFATRRVMLKSSLFPGA